MKSATAILLWVSLLLGIGLYVHKHHDVRSSPRFRESYLHGLVSPDKQLAPLCRWDCNWYAKIAQEGYQDKTNKEIYGFFPLYPWVTRGLVVLGVNPYTAVIVVNAVLLFVFAWLLTLFPPGEILISPFRAVVFFLAFPGAYVLLAGYAETLFLVLAAATILCLLKQRPGLSFLFAFLAGLTRLQALTLCLLPVFQWMMEKKVRRSTLIPAAGAFLGVMAFFLFVGIDTGNLRAFYEVKASVRGGSSWYAIWTPIWTWMKYMVMAKGQPVRIHFFTDLLATLILGATAFWFWKKKMFWQATLPAAHLMMSLLSGSLWGITRYSTAAFPIYFFLGTIMNTRQKAALWIAIGFALQFRLFVDYLRFDVYAP